MRIRWAPIIMGIVCVSIAVAMVRDVWATYSDRRALENRVAAVAREAARHLPYDIPGAMRTVTEGLEGAGVEVAPDGTSITVRASESTYAWFAWLFGKPRLYFKAEETVRIALEGGGPVGALPSGEVLLAIGRRDDLLPGIFVALTPARPGALDPLWIYAYDIEAGDDLVAVGDVVSLRPLSEETAAKARALAESDPDVERGMVRPDSPRLPRVAVVDVAGETGTVVGFAAFLLAADEGDGKIRGSLREVLLEADPGAPGPRPGFTPRDFGLRRAGQVRIL